MGGRCTIRNEENMKKKTVAVCMANIDEQYNDIFYTDFVNLRQKMTLICFIFIRLVRFILWIRMISESGKYIV